MKKTTRKILICAAVSACALSLAAFAACGGSSSTSLRTQLDSVDESTVSFDFDAGTFSFTAVENATYYRVYFYNVEEPSEDLDNYDYFVYTTDEDSDDTASASAATTVRSEIALARTGEEDNNDDESGSGTETDGTDNDTDDTTGDDNSGDGSEEGGEQGGDDVFVPGPDMGGDAPAFGDAGSSVTYNFEKDADGNYVLQDTDTILSQSATYSKRYNAYYYDEETDTKTYYEAGDTVTFTLPNDSLSGGRYIIGIKSGGPLALYTLSDWCVIDTTLKLKYVTPEINSGDWSWSWSVTDATYKDTDGNELSEGTPSNGNGMMMELVNAESLYAANSAMELSFYITDSTGNKVSFTYYDLNMTRTDGNALSYWTIAHSGTSTQTGTWTIGYSVYSHDGPTMHYASYGYVYITGLTESTEYTIHVQAEAPTGSATAISSDEGTFTFTFTVQTEGTT